MHARKHVFPLLAAFTVCSLAPAQETSGLFHDPQYKFAAQPPAGAKVSYEATAGSDVGFDAHSGQETYWIHAEPSPAENLDVFVQKQEKVINGLCSNTPSFEDSDTTISGQPAKEIRTVCASNDPDALGAKRIVRVQIVMRQMEEQGTVVYTLGMLTTAKRESKTMPVYDAMVSSFQLLE